jgi:capsular exopolysaccharide synthesis family protein
MPQQAEDISELTMELKPNNSHAEEQAVRSTPGAKTASVSRARSELHQGLILLAEGYIENQIAAERFRILRAKIERLNLAQRRYKVLAVTSAVPSEGKSVVAVNLARALSIDPLGKTLLVDCDLRKPSVQRFFRTPRESGLSDALFHRRMNNRFIRSVGPNLDLMTAGTAVVDPTEAIEQPEFDRFVSELREYYRYIVIDCPPVLLCPEPIRISAAADTTILVARAWRTNRRLVQEAVEVIGAQKILGIVLNEGLDASHQYSDYGYYAYYSQGSAPKAG